MKSVTAKWLVLLFVVASVSLSARAYEVQNGKQQGYDVVADNFVYIITPDKQKIQVTTIPFVGNDYQIPPVEPILCTWDPDRKWLGIFITVKQITEIHFFNLKTNSMLHPLPVDWSQYPKWFGAKRQLFTHTKPVKWTGNKLVLDTLVKFRDGTEKHLTEFIVINDDTFQRLVENDQRANQ